MYDFLFNNSIFEVSLSIYALGTLCLVLGIKLIKLEKENRKNVDLILYLHDRVSKLEEDQQ